MLQYTVAVLLKQEPGAALCDSCLAFACSTSLNEIRCVTEALVAERGQFQRCPACASCRRTVPSTFYKALAKCAHCSGEVYDAETMSLGDQILHVHCFRILTTDGTMAISRGLNRRSRQLIAESRRRMQGQ
jgi:hypothetical protein